MIVKVTKKHIAKGDCKNIRSCALALAVLDSVKGAKKVEVCNEIEVFHKDGTVSVYQMNDKASSFIDRFDTHRDLVKPDTFVFKKVKVKFI